MSSPSLALLSIIQHMRLWASSNDLTTLSHKVKGRIMWGNDQEEDPLSSDAHLAQMRRIDALRAHHGYISTYVVAGAKTMSNQVLRGGRLWIDGSNGAEHDMLRARQITAVCALGEDHSHYAAPLDCVHYLRITLHDYHYENIKAHFESATTFIHEQLSKPQGRVLVHCAAGVSRSATICMAYLMRYHQLPFDGAYAAVLAARCVVDPNPGFIEQLKAWENELTMLFY